jgi:hypothetical protein
LFDVIRVGVSVAHVLIDNLGSTTSGSRLSTRCVPIVVLGGTMNDSRISMSSMPIIVLGSSMDDSRLSMLLTLIGGL